MACNTLLTYPDFNETFKIQTDASAFQLGAVIRHKGKPIAFYSRKLTYHKQLHTVTNKEVLSIVETLKEFRTILLGLKLIIYTNNENLTYIVFNTYRLLRWGLILEEYGLEIDYTKGEKNMVSDALSILPLNGNQETTHNSTYQQEIV